MQLPVAEAWRVRSDIPLDGALQVAGSYLWSVPSSQEELSLRS